MHTEFKERKCLAFLSMLYLTVMSSSLLLSYRFVNVGPLLTVASVFVIPFTYSISDLIAEFYGYNVIRSVIWKTLICLFILSLVLTILQTLPANKEHDTYTQAYHLVFHGMLRIYSANLIAILLGMFLNSYILVKWKILVKGKIFMIRSMLSSVIGELIFTSVVVGLVQIGVSNFSAISEMILVSFSIKVIFTLLSSIIAAFVKPLIQMTEGKDVFQATKNYNPFIFTTK
jgi:uncharacterized integral membrane protein (TIGR00697 family)